MTSYTSNTAFPVEMNFLRKLKPPGHRCKQDPDIPWGKTLMTRTSLIPFCLFFFCSVKVSFESFHFLHNYCNVFKFQGKSKSSFSFNRGLLVHDCLTAIQQLSKHTKFFNYFLNVKETKLQAGIFGGQISKQNFQLLHKQYGKRQMI